jgi:subtilase family serine protease
VHGADVSAGTTLNVYANDDTGERLVATSILPEILAGTSLDGIEFPLTAADIGKYGWIVRVDEEGDVAECDETNNEDRYTDSICP